MPGLREYAEAAGLAGGVSAPRGPAPGRPPPDRPGADRLVLDRRGMRCDVLVDAAGGRVWRFPRSAADAARVGDAAARLAAAAAAGLPVAVPPVLAVVEGPAGRAHLCLGYVPGVALDDPRAAALPAAACARLGRDLAALAVAARTAPWPLPCTGWAQLWEGMAARVRAAVVPLLAPADAARAQRDLDAAVAAARAAPLGVVHGDMGGVNVRVDPATGAVTGLLDWDEAVRGDAAVDLAAVEQALPAAARAALDAAGPSLAAERERFAAYLPTWALQQALWGAERGDAAMRGDGLRRYALGGALSGRSRSPGTPAPP